MITLSTIEMWSETEQSIVTWNIALETETDEGGNEHQILAARYKDEIKRFSPNTTDEQLKLQVGIINGTLDDRGRAI